MIAKICRRLLPFTLAAGLLLLPCARILLPFYEVNFAPWALLYGWSVLAAIIAAGTRCAFVVPRKQTLVISIALSACFLASLAAWPSVDLTELTGLLALVLLAFAASTQASLGDGENLWRYSKPVVRVALLLFFALGQTRFFGQQNIASEYLGLSALLLVFGPRKNRAHYALLAVDALLSLAALLWMLQAGSRAALLGTALTMATLSPPRLRRWAAIPALGLFLLFTVVVLGRLDWQKFQGPQSGKGSFWEQKAENSRSRLVRWANTVVMIRHHPLGVGPGNYPFEYVPYRKALMQDVDLNEDIIIRSPHSLPLKLLAEWGVLNCILGALLLYWALRKSKIPRAAKAVLTFIAIDGAFASPLEGAYPAALIALSLGPLISQGLSSAGRRRFTVPAYAAVAPLLLALPLMALHLQGQYLVQHEGMDLNADLIKLERLCGRYPSLWQGCWEGARLALSLGEPKKAEAMARRVLTRQPHNYFVLHTLGEALWAQGRKEEACVPWVRYVRIFERFTRYRDVEKFGCRGAHAD